MADNDGDSRMASSPELTDDEEVETPLDQITDPTILSPPDSQHRDSSNSNISSMPTSTPTANANGKRPAHTISSGGAEDPLDLDAPIPTSSEPAAANTGKAREAGRAAGSQEFPPRTHRASGYSWTRAEGEPGYTWLNKKAVDERQRAVEGLVHKECRVGNRYGDPFELAEREQAMRNSLKLR
ncbi:hypothetical protein LTR62_001997 [Meristemomyces frigidus]|uniref:Uncharacterized protein n=1 Tax=Meristemomyces frigidus TaxID=1508187 RepID=A0AAN7TRT6_9PEZI|nr:hypothetical protein LTR62_001997 [Meristemomyces frigidus]